MHNHTFMRIGRTRTVAPAVFVLLVLALGSACQPSGAAASTPGPVVATINVTEKSFNILLDQTVVPPGAIKFILQNQGPDQHEFVVVRTDLPADQLPVDSYLHKVEEDNLTEPYNHDHFPPGDQIEAVVSLEPGHYVVMCNLAGHYIKGMRASFTVTAQAAPTQTAQAQATQNAPSPTPTPSPMPTNTTSMTATVQTAEVVVNDANITVNPGSVSGKRVMFRINVQGSMQHDLAIIQTSMDPGSLPVSNDQANLEAEGLTLIADLADLTPGDTNKITLSMSPGNYVLLDPKNYENGLYTGFTVNSP